MKQNTTFAPTVTRRAALLGAASFLAACASRGEVTMMRPIGEAAFVDILVATNRARAGGDAIFSGQRQAQMNFADVTVSIPPAHQAGELELPRRRVDPTRHFGVTGVSHVDGELAFSNLIARRAIAMPMAEREAVVYVHGFNTNFAESMYRLAQMFYDFRSTGIPVLFSWPSSGDAKNYLYDRDSILFARDALEQLMDRLENSQVQRIQLIGHSMGCQLIVEALRQRAIRRNQVLWSKLDGVILISPDIDIDVFTGMADEIGTLPQPFVIMTSNKDRALQLSAWVNDSRTRLGSVRDASQLAAMAVTVVDTTDEASRLSINHMTGATSPAMIAFLRGVRNSRIVETPLSAQTIELPDWIRSNDDGVR